MPYPLLIACLQIRKRRSEKNFLLNDSFHLDAEIIGQELHGARFHCHALERPGDRHLVHAEAIRDLGVTQPLLETLSFQNFNLIHGLPPLIRLPSARIS